MKSAHVPWTSREVQNDNFAIYSKNYLKLQRMCNFTVNLRPSECEDMQCIYAHVRVFGQNHEL